MTNGLTGKRLNLRRRPGGFGSFLEPLSGCLRTNELRQNAESIATMANFELSREVLTLEGALYKESVSALVAVSGEPPRCNRLVGFDLENVTLLPRLCRHETTRGVKSL